MVRSDDRDHETSGSHWLGVMFLGLVGAVPGFFVFAMALSHGTATRANAIVNSTFFFGPLVLAVVGLLGHARSKRRQQVDRERGTRATRG